VASCVLCHLACRFITYIPVNIGPTIIPPRPCRTSSRLPTHIDRWMIPRCCKAASDILGLILVERSDAHAMFGITDPHMDILQSIIWSSKEPIEINTCPHGSHDSQVWIVTSPLRILVSSREDKGHFGPRSCTHSREWIRPRPVLPETRTRYCKGEWDGVVSTGVEIQRPTSTGN